MPSVPVLDASGKASATLELSPEVFGSVHLPMLHQGVVRELADRRTGTHDTKGRSEVSGGGKKPWRQKGTGRARAGTIRSPLWRGGGTVFGPHPRDHRLKVNKKVRRAALKSSLTARAKDGDILVIKALEFAAPKTKAFASVLKNMDAHKLKKALVILDKADVPTIKSARNVTGVRIAMADSVTTYDVVWADKIVLTDAALRRMEEVYAS
jgi:large subunit ribosomal protein L4